MKKQAARYLSALTLICLAMATTIGLNSSLRVKFHRQLQHRIADARTVTAAIRYLAEPELPDSLPSQTDWKFAATNWAKTAARPASRVVPGAINLPSLITSNGVATTQTNTTVPG